MKLNSRQRRDFVILTVGTILSRVGDMLAMVVLYLRLAPHGGFYAVAGIALAASIPAALVSPWAGSLADSRPARRLIIVATAVQAAGCAGLAVETGPLWTILLLSVVTAGGGISAPAMQALLPHIVGDENISEAMSWGLTARGISQIAGPALGGLLVAAVGTRIPLVIDAASFVVLMMALFLLQQDRVPHVASGEKVLAREGWQFIRSNRLLATLIAATTVFAMAISIINVAEVFLITRHLHGTSLQYGLVGTAAGIGALVGSVWSRSLGSDSLRLARSFVMQMLALGVGVAAMGLQHVLWPIFPLSFALGVSEARANVAINSLLVHVTPDQQRGRVFSALGATFVVASTLAYAVSGTLLSWLSPSAVFLLGGLSSAVVAVVARPIIVKAVPRATAL